MVGDASRVYDSDAADVGSDAALRTDGEARDASTHSDATADSEIIDHDALAQDSTADVYVGCGATCVSEDNACIASCASAEELCAGNCPNGGNCPQQCQTTQMQCGMHCMMTCMMCLPQCTGPSPCPSGGI
jgi:hypothetical protein